MGSIIAGFAGIWKINAPLEGGRLAAFGWFALSGEWRPFRREIIIVDKCPVCLKDAELANHILVACQLGSSPLDGCFGFDYSWVLRDIL